MDIKYVLELYVPCTDKIDVAFSTEIIFIQCCFCMSKKFWPIFLSIPTILKGAGLLGHI